MFKWNLNSGQKYNLFVDIFANQNGLQKADTLFSLLCNFAVEYAIAEVQVNESRLKLNGPHQLPLYANDVNLLRESINTIHEN